MIGLINFNRVNAQRQVYYFVGYGAMQIANYPDQLPDDPPIMIPYMDSMYYELTDSSNYVVKLNELILSHMNFNMEGESECQSDKKSVSARVQIDKNVRIKPVVIIYSKDCGEYSFLYWDYSYKGSYGWPYTNPTTIIGFGMDDEQLLFDYQELNKDQLFDDLVKEGVNVKLELQPTSEIKIKRIISKIL